MGVATTPKKLDGEACSPHEAGCPSKLPSQALKAGFNYMPNYELLLVYSLMFCQVQVDGHTESEAYDNKSTVHRNRWAQS